MKKTLFTAALAACLGFCSDPSFAKGYVVNGHAATKAEAQLLTSYRAPAGEWRVDGYGIARVADEHASRVVQVAGPKCWYVLDVKLCD